MRIKLLKDIEEDGKVKVTLRPKKKFAFAWYAGNEIDVSDETGRKFIARGDAEEVTVEVKEEAAAEAGV